MQMHIDKYERAWIVAVTIILAVFFASLVAGAVIYGVRPTQPDGFINPLMLDESEFANPGVRHMGGNQYEAIVMAQAWQFLTGEVEDGVPVIRVPAGAEVTFRMTTRDVIHGFMIEDDFVLVYGRTQFALPAEVQHFTGKSVADVDHGSRTNIGFPEGFDNVTAGFRFQLPTHYVIESS